MIGPIDNPARSQYKAGSFHCLDFQIISAPKKAANAMPTPRNTDVQKIIISIPSVNKPDPSSYVI